jgi:hypothetical protein
LKFKYLFFFLITMTHDDKSIPERVIALAEEVNCTVSLRVMQEHGYRNPGRMGNLESA